MANPGLSAAAEAVAKFAWEEEDFEEEANRAATAELLAALQRHHPEGDCHAG